MLKTVPFLLIFFLVSSSSGPPPRDEDLLSPTTAWSRSRRFMTAARTSETGRKTMTWAMAQLREGMRLHGEKQYQQAILVYRKALQKAPIRYLYFHYGESLLAAGAFDTALKAFRCAITPEYRTDVKILFAMARASSLAGRTSDTLRLLKQCLGFRDFNPWKIISHHDLDNFRKSPLWPDFYRNSYHAAWQLRKKAPHFPVLQDLLDSENYSGALALLRKSSISGTHPADRAALYYHYLQKNEIRACHLLIEHLLDPDDKYGEAEISILVLTINMQQEALALLLIKKGANPYYGSLYHHTVSPLIAAAGMGFYSVVRELLARGMHPDLAAPGSRTALAVAAAKEDLEMVRILLAAKADPDAVLYLGESPYTIAITTRNDALIRIFNAAREHNSNSIFLKMFQDRYCGRKLVCQAINRVFTFTPGHDFPNNGVGTFRLTELHKQNHMFEQGTFQIRSNQMELVRRMSYMQFALKFIIQPIDARRIRINGDIFRIETP